MRGSAGGGAAFYPDESMPVILVEPYTKRGKKTNFVIQGFLNTHTEPF